MLSRRDPGPAPPLYALRCLLWAIDSSMSRATNNEIAHQDVRVMVEQLCVGGLVSPKTLQFAVLTRISMGASSEFGALRFTTANTATLLSKDVLEMDPRISLGAPPASDARGRLQGCHIDMKSRACAITCRRHSQTESVSHCYTYGMCHLRMLRPTGVWYALPEMETFDLGTIPAVNTITLRSKHA